MFCLESSVCVCVCVCVLCSFDVIAFLGVVLDSSGKSVDSPLGWRSKSFEYVLAHASPLKGEKTPLCWSWLVFLHDPIYRSKFTILLSADPCSWFPSRMLFSYPHLVFNFITERRRHLLCLLNVSNRQMIYVHGALVGVKGKRTRQAMSAYRNTEVRSCNHFAVENNKCYTFWLCVCSLRYPACNAHASYYHLWPVSLFPHCLMNSMIFGEKIIEHKKLNKDRPTWCHLVYYFIIWCSTCFEC
jgi:hypothetical protein